MATAVITATPKSIRPHIMMAELDSMYGRRWTKPMPKHELDLHLWQTFRVQPEVGLSDYDCSGGCWCYEDYVKQFQEA